MAAMITKALSRGNNKTVKLYKQGKKWGVIVIPDGSFTTKKECQSLEDARQLFEQLAANR